MKCPKCGNELADNLKFCDQCGAAMSEEAAAVTEAAAAEETAPAAEETVAEQPVEAVSEPESEVKEEKIVEDEPSIQEAVQPDEVVEQSTPAERKINTMGLVGFIVGVASFFLGGWGFISAIVAIIFSAIGIKNFNPETEKGKGFAIAGLVLGIVAVVLLFIAIVIVAGAVSYGIFNSL